MPKRMDLTEIDEQELDLEEEGTDDEELDDTEEDEEDPDSDDEGSDDEGSDDEDGDDDDTAPKKRKAPRRGEDSADIKRQLDAIQAALASKKGTETSRQKKVDDLLGRLKATGKFTDNQLGVLALLSEAIQEDLGAEYQEEQKKLSQKQLFDNADAEFKRAMDRWVKKYPQMRWSRKEITQQAMELLFKGRGFESARAQFEQQILPDSEEFEKAVSRIAKNYLKDHGIKSSNSSEQLDVRSSRSKPADKSVSKKGELDTSKLSDREKEIYWETKNATKDEDLAREALAAFRKYKRAR